MKKSELIFVPSPAIGHLPSAIEAAKLLLYKDNRLSITVFLFKRQIDSNLTSYYSDLTTTPRLRFVTLPMVESETLSFSFMDLQKPQVRKATSDLFSASNSPLAGFILDMFCTSMMDVAAEFRVPSYIYYAANATFLGFMFHLQLLNDEQQIDVAQAKDSEVDLEIPVFTKPFPARVLPTVVHEKDLLAQLLNHKRRFREAKGILVNTYMDLESHALDSLSKGNNPLVYPVGPVLNLGSKLEIHDDHKEIMDWLDHQPLATVVFLCFGSRGAFSVEQVKEIACALERSKHRFLWSLRRPLSKGENTSNFPTQYENLEEVLPIGFLDRTVGTGKIIGWGPQSIILAHPAVGGFVSHCGWNSALESLWFGVPIATWPMYSEQQLNAFELVKELELAVEIKMDYRKDSGMIVKAEEIEKGIRRLMEQDSQIRKRVKEMSEKGKMALMEGGSSCFALNRFIHDVFNNVS